MFLSGYAPAISKKIFTSDQKRNFKGENKK
jgi:hypothetical protein